MTSSFSTPEAEVSVAVSHAVESARKKRRHSTDTDTEAVAQRAERHGKRFLSIELGRWYPHVVKHYLQKHTRNGKVSTMAKSGTITRAHLVSVADLANERSGNGTDSLINLSFSRYVAHLETAPISAATRLEA